MQISFISETGKVRGHNEDSGTIVTNKSNEYLLIVADGMGGHKAGEVASSITVTHLGERFRELGTIGTKEDAINWIKDNVEEINLNIIKTADKNPDSKGMGTTLVCSILTNDYLLFANIGDSSGFVKKGSKLYKVTKDHTLVNLMVETGKLSKEEARNHPQKNILMKALGAADRVEADIFDVETDIDEILLCSDGLTNMLTVEQIKKVLNDKDLSCEERVKKLVNKSNARGGTDNITIAYLIKEEGVS